MGHQEIPQIAFFKRMLTHQHTEPGMLANEWLKLNIAQPPPPLISCQAHHIFASCKLNALRNRHSFVIMAWCNIPLPITMFAIGHPFLLDSNFTTHFEEEIDLEKPAFMSPAHKVQFHTTYQRCVRLCTHASVQLCVLLVE